MDEFLDLVATVQQGAGLKSVLGVCIDVRDELHVGDLDTTRRSQTIVTEGLGEDVGQLGRDSVVRIDVDPGPSASARVCTGEGRFCLPRPAGRGGWV